MHDILIVDDDPDMAAIVKEVLEAVGFRCRLATNGVQALDETAADMPDLVLMDMLMPVMNGWECAHALREAYGARLPIVIMTAAEHAGSRREETNADAVITKPFELRELIRVVRAFFPASSEQPEQSERSN